jgi:hypothetical protein
MIGKFSEILKIGSALFEKAVLERQKKWIARESSEALRCNIFKHRPPFRLTNLREETVQNLLPPEAVAGNKLLPGRKRAALFDEVLVQRLSKLLVVGRIALGNQLSVEEL